MINLTLAGLATVALLNGATCPVEQMGFYADTMRVIDIDEDNDLATAMDANGNIGDWEGIEDLEKNDSVALVMCDNGTPNNIYDDIIVDVRYNGYFFTD